MIDENEIKKQLDAIVEQGTSPSTRRAYREDTRRFWDWAKDELGIEESYPIHISVILQYILSHLPAEGKKGLKVTTIRRYISSLSVAHQEHGVASTTRDPKVGFVLKRAKRALKQKPHKKAAATVEILRALVATCDHSLRGTRDRAILLVGFAAGGRRRAELAALQVSDLTKVKDGYLICIGRSKNDQDGDGHTVPVFGEAARALSRWLVKSGIREGFVFRGVRRNDQLNGHIHPRTINRIVKRCARNARLNPKEFGAHSLRSGFLTEAVDQGVQLRDAMQLSGHKTEAVAQGYYRNKELARNRATDLLAQRDPATGQGRPKPRG